MPFSTPSKSTCQKKNLGRGLPREIFRKRRFRPLPLSFSVTGQPSPKLFKVQFLFFTFLKGKKGSSFYLLLSFPSDRWRPLPPLPLQLLARREVGAEVPAGAERGEREGKADLERTCRVRGENGAATPLFFSSSILRPRAAASRPTESLGSTTRSTT